MKVIKVVLADDHTIVRNGIKSTLSGDKKIKIIGEAENGLEAIEAVKKLHPDVLIVDISMPEMNGLKATAEITRKYPDTKCLILSMHDKEEYVLEAIESGASGYLLKDSDFEEFVKAIKTVASGEKYFSAPVSGILAEGYLHRMKQTDRPEPRSNDPGLTKRERNILKMIVDGANNRQIADELDISIRTIETHRSNIMKKMNVRNAVDMVRVAMEQKLV